MAEQQQYFYGALPPTVHPTAYQFAEHKMATAPRPPVFDALAGIDVPVLNQRSTASCVGHALATIMMALYASAGAGGTPLSPEMPWELAKQLEGSLGQNVGCAPHDALTQTRNLGICSLATMPLDVINYGVLPSQDALADAQARVGSTFQQCQGRDELLNAMGTLQVPGLLAIAVYGGFERASSAGIITDVNVGPILGYHAITCRSYDDNAQTVRIRNSWGQAWGQSGEATLTYAQVDAIMTEGWATQLAVTPSPQPAWSWQPVAAWITAAAAWAVANDSLPELDVIRDYLVGVLPV